MALTYLQVVNRIRTLVLSHDQINNFYFGDLHEFDSNGEISYAGCFCQSLPGAINRTEREQLFNFRIYFADLVGVSTETEQNETEVISDMSSVAADFLAMLQSTTYQDDWTIKEGVAVTPFTEALNDLVAGVFMDVSIAVDFLSDRCQVPADDVTFETDFDMARTKILTYDGTGSEGDTFTVVDSNNGEPLAGKTVLAVYRAGNYRRAITTVPAASDYIGVNGTDLGSNKGILSSDGEVYLQSGDALISGEVLDFLIWST